MAGQGTKLPDDFNVAALLLLATTAGQMKQGSLQPLAPRETPKEPFIEGDPGPEEPPSLLRQPELAVAVPPPEEPAGQRSSCPTPKNRQTAENPTPSPRSYSDASPPPSPAGESGGNSLGSARLELVNAQRRGEEKWEGEGEEGFSKKHS
jgi:hypothetical protein